MDERDINQVVRDKYGEAALRVTSGGSSCCGASASTGYDPITANLYDANQAGQIPEEALLAGIDADAIAPEMDGRFMGAFVRAVKPTPRAC